MENKTLLISAKDIIGCEFNTELSCAELFDKNQQFLNHYTEVSSNSIVDLETELATRLFSTAVNTVIKTISQKAILDPDYRNELLLVINRKINTANISETEQLSPLLEESFEALNNEPYSENAKNYITIVMYTIHTNMNLLANVSFSLK